jgi:hypothetical protein
LIGFPGAVVTPHSFTGGLLTTVGAFHLIDFEGLGKEEDGSVMISLERAVDFVMELEGREAEALPEDRDMTALDSRLGGVKDIRRSGYVGEIRGPTSSWIQD